MKTRIVRTARLGVIALVLVGVLAYVRRVPWTPAIATMRHASLGLLALALCFHFMALAGKAGIWWIFLRPLGGPRIHDRRARYAHGSDAQQPLRRQQR